jgi:hypothetical protein
MNREYSLARRNILAITAIAVASLAGCASDPAPVDSLARAHAAIRQAAPVSVRGTAPRELALASEKVALAERWMAAGDQRPARWLVEQAQVDAELAAMKAASMQARARAADMLADYRARNSGVVRIASRSDS